MPPRICFLALNAYPTLASTSEMDVGGAEIQQGLIARYLVRRGYEVSFVVRDHGQPDATVINGITVYKTFKRGRGLRYLRFIHPRLTGIWNALRRANADIFYQRCAAMETGLLAAFCRMHGKKSVFASASDSDFMPDRVIISNSLERGIYNYGLRHVNAIITQTETQRAQLAKNFDLDAVVIPNCWSEETTGANPAASRGYVLWVSTFRDWKRPGLFIDLAKRLPDIRFVMVGGSSVDQESLYQRISEQSRNLPNLSFEGFIPFHLINRYFDGARIVVNTSEPKEGFPNAFLQAWSRGLPVASFFDPDGLIRRHGLGIAVNNFDEMQAAIVSFCCDEKLYAEARQRVAAYFNTHHHIDILGPRYEAFFDNLIGRTS